MLQAACCLLLQGSRSRPLAINDPQHRASPATRRSVEACSKPLSVVVWLFHEEPPLGSPKSPRLKGVVKTARLAQIGLRKIVGNRPLIWQRDEKSVADYAYYYVRGVRAYKKYRAGWKLARFMLWLRSERDFFDCLTENRGKGTPQTHHRAR